MFPCNCSNEIASSNIFCHPNLIPLLFVVLGGLLLCSVLLNIYCCVSRCSSGKKKHQRRRKNQNHMEDNPIYGNIIYEETDTRLLADSGPPLHSSFSSVSGREQQRVMYTAQQEPQDCYANLAIKPPRIQCGGSSPQTPHSRGGSPTEEAPEAREQQAGGGEEERDAVKEEEENAGNPDLSELYATVQTQRSKVVCTSNTGEEYANHL